MLDACHYTWIIGHLEHQHHQLTNQILDNIR